MDLPPLSVYIHLPWCERKCPYCDFNSHETHTIPVTQYTQALLQDLNEDIQYVESREIVSVFLGGGTPSLFPVEAIEQIIDGLKTTLTLASDCEITMEANPGSAEALKFKGFYAAGVNRLSVGVQSFSDRYLEGLGRVHNGAQAHEAIEHLVSAGFENFNIDLMHGLPGQSAKDAKSDLEQALAYEPTHLSWYQLTLEPNTAFYSSPPELPHEIQLAAIADDGEALLAAHGMRNYEVSAYEKQGNYSRHNMNYWSFGDYLGLGAGAHAKISQPEGDILRFSRLRQPDAYLASHPSKRRCNQRELAPEDRVGEFMLNALRLTAGFTRHTFTDRTGIDYRDVADQIESLVSRDLLEVKNEAIRTTALGRRFLDSVVEEFF